MARKPQIFRKEFIEVSFLLEHLESDVGVPLEVVVEGAMAGRRITEKDLHRPGLALSGFLELFTHERVQIIGNTESKFLAHLSKEDRKKAFGHIVGYDIPCIIVSESNDFPDELAKMSKEKGIPVFRSSLPTSDLMSFLQDFLSDQFALQRTLHGSLVDVYGVGLLLTGQPGIGKSEVSLDLIERGHRLVADDVVVVTKKNENVLIGSGTKLVEHFMEIRGLGIVDIRAMFGVRAVRYQKRIEIVVDLQLWDSTQEYTRLGMVDDQQNILDVEIPRVKLPIVPGKNITVICEVVAMNHLLDHYGYNAAEVFSEKLKRRIALKRQDDSVSGRGIEYFEHDYE